VSDDAEVREVMPLDNPPDAVVRVPGSRSISNRALVCAALADGTSTLTGVLDSDDTQAMLGCLTSLGIRWRDLGDHVIEVDGCGGELPPGPAALHTRLSGTTSRFVTALCALGHGAYTVDADGPMRERPMGDLVAALRSLGVRVEDTDGHLPITVHADGLQGGVVELAGDVSSQYLSALMLAGAAAPHGVEVRLTGPLKSVPYVLMTAKVMDAFGADSVATDLDALGTISVPPHGYSPIRYEVEPDASTACYFWAAAAITGGRVRVEGLGPGSLQGDWAFVDVLEEMGCVVEREDHATTVTGPERLRSLPVMFPDQSDQAPTFAAVAAFADGWSRASGIGFIRRKESDRIAAVVEGLRRLGVEAHEDEDGDGFTLTGCGPEGPPHGGRIRTFDDHRIAMSFALVGLRTPGVLIEDPSCVGKTFPGFFDALEGLRR
jgi:3-phosphoshikimate 1-carboxyvinyltransferase